MKEYVLIASIKSTESAATQDRGPVKIKMQLSLAFFVCVNSKKLAIWTSKHPVPPISATFSFLEPTYSPRQKGDPSSIQGSPFVFNLKTQAHTIGLGF